MAEVGASLVCSLSRSFFFFVCCEVLERARWFEHALRGLFTAP